jgi:hypothetical protein
VGFGDMSPNPSGFLVRTRVSEPRCRRNVVRQRLPHVSEGPNIMIASLADLINLLIEGQSLVHQLSKTLDNCGWLYRDTRRFQGAQDVASASTGGVFDGLRERPLWRSH